MFDRISDKAVRFVPGTRFVMERALFWLGYLGAEEIGEERVVAIPAAFVVERDQEEIGLLQIGQNRLAIVLLGDGIAERRAEAIENRGLAQEGADLGRLLPQDFLRQIVDDVAMPPAESVHGMRDRTG